MSPLEHFSIAHLAGGRLFSFIMPFYNEGEHIVENIATVLKTAQEMGIQAEIIAVDDGSQDNGFEKLQEAYAHNPSVIVIRNDTNFGKGWALKTGYEFSHGDFIIFLDSDLELSPWHIPQFFVRMVEQQADVVIGSKLHPESQVNYPLIRRILSIGYYSLIRILFRLPIMDTQTGIKLFRREALEASLPRVLVKRFAFDIELLAIMISKGYRIISAPICLHFKRQGIGNIKLKTVLNVFWDTLAVVYRFSLLHYYDRELGKPKKYTYRVILFSNGDEKEKRHLEQYLSLPYPHYDVVVIGANQPSLSSPQLKWIYDTSPLFSQRLLHHPEVFSEEKDAFVMGTLHSSPDKRFFLNLGRLLSLPHVGMIGGIFIPASDETPEGRFFFDMMRSIFLNGPFSYRYKHGVQMEVKELGIEGLIVKKSILEQWFASQASSTSTDKLEHQLALICRQQKKTLLYSPDIMMFGYFPQNAHSFFHWVQKEARIRAHQNEGLQWWYFLIGMLLTVWIGLFITPWRWWCGLPWLLCYGGMIVSRLILSFPHLLRGLAQVLFLSTAQILYSITFLTEHWKNKKK